MGLRGSEQQGRRFAKIVFCALAGSLLLSNIAPLPAAERLTTVAEQSLNRRTGRYDEVERLCRAFARQWPNAVRCMEFGRTPEDRPLVALIASRNRSALTPEQGRAGGVPVILIQGGIHAGEIDGKDAGFLALRHLLENRKPGNPLEKLTFVLVPVLNADGHERFGKWNRPNQVGPEEMGWRTTAQNLNLNRDYTKADAPETRAILGLLGDWDPILYVDLHVTDGAQFEHDVSIQVEPMYSGDQSLRPIGAALQTDMLARLKARGSLPLGFYPQLKEPNNPSAGFAVSPYLPRFSTGYWGLRNRFAVLVETHSWKSYAKRVRITHDTIMALTDLTAKNGRAWIAASKLAEDQSRAIGGSVVTLDLDVSDKSRMIDFRGYAYTREPSTISGAIALKYNPRKPQIWKVPFYDDVRPVIQVTAPVGGYVVAPAHARWLADRLKIHGIESRLVGTQLPAQTVETFRADRADFDGRPYEGRLTATLTGEWKRGQQTVLRGSLFVPIAQAKSRLVMMLLEPRSPDSFASWGFFNAHFETKEYMEDYVAEDVAKEMLAKRPELVKEFREKLSSDEAFAKDSAARLAFFTSRHVSADDRLNLYPVVRVGVNY